MNRLAKYIGDSQMLVFNAVAGGDMNQQEEKVEIAADVKSGMVDTEIANLRDEPYHKDARITAIEDNATRLEQILFENRAELHYLLKDFWDMSLEHEAIARVEYQQSGGE